MNTAVAKSYANAAADFASDISYRGALIFLGAAVLGAIVYVKFRASYELAGSPALLFYTFFVTTFQLSRLIGAMLYGRVRDTMHARTRAAAQTHEPAVSFVIPCKNEEGAIEKTISKCFAADYPPELLEVIVVNDGSTDRTPQVLNTLKKRYPRLIVVNWKENRGKRHAMAEGFRRASGEIVVQLDSDSYIVPSTFRNLIRPFANPEIGAVCAHADPENADENTLTKMQAAYYFISFRILKAAESAFLTVFCCSGCSSAYRRDLIMPVLDRWLAEKFLGLPVTWGDDRALTNWVLRQGYHTVYTDEARAFTIVPNRLRQFLKQQVRWKKGWFVNSLFASRFMAKREPFVAFTYFYPLILVTLATPFMAARAFVYNPVANDIAPVFYMLGVFLVASSITIFYRFVARENKYWPYIFVWAALNMVVLSFILFYALFRIRDRRWGTR